MMRILATLLLAALCRMTLVIVILLFAPPIPAATWHIRIDGGDQSQCTGRTAAAYSPRLARNSRGIRGAQVADCAFNHPFWLLDQGKWTWLTAQGDSIQFDDQGPYYLGQGPFKGLGQNWPHCGAYASDCVLPAGMPDGTKILGKNAGHCGTDYTVWSGIHGLFWMLNVEGSDHVDLECIEITQPDPCSKVGNNPTTITSTQMSGGSAVYGWTKGYYNPPKVGEPVTITGTINGGGVFNVTNKVIASMDGSTFTIAGFSGDIPRQAEPNGMSKYAGLCDATQNWATHGLVLAYMAGTQGPSNFTLRDFYVHGIANTGILGSKLNRNATDTFTADRVRIIGNGVSGFETDNGGCTTNCESKGIMNLTDINAEWNGCIMVSPGIYSFCVDQAYGGAGDNLVMIATGGVWNWKRVTTKYGMQDCFDSLHTGDDPHNLPVINAEYIYAEGCEGAAIKFGGAEITLRNSIGISNCEAMMLHPEVFPKNLPGWNSFLGANCRANDSFVFAMNPGHKVTIENVDNLGQQGVGWDFAGPCNGDCEIDFRNNTTVGYHNESGNANMAGFYWSYPVSPFANPASSMTNNNYFGLRTGCPGDPDHEQGAVCANPLFVAGDDVNHLDAHLKQESPLIGAGAHIPETSPDYDGNLRPDPQSIGYVEHEGAPVPPIPPQRPCVSVIIGIYKFCLEQVP